MSRAFNITADVTAGAAIASSLMDWLPVWAALGGIIWYGIQIWESKTVQKWVRVHRYRARIRRQVVKAVKAQLRVQEAGAALEKLNADEDNAG